MVTYLFTYLLDCQRSLHLHIMQMRHVNSLSWEWRIIIVRWFDRTRKRRVRTRQSGMRLAETRWRPDGSRQYSCLWGCNSGQCLWIIAVLTVYSVVVYIDSRVCTCVESVASEVYHVVQKFFLVFKYSDDALVCVDCYDCVMSSFTGFGSRVLWWLGRGGLDMYYACNTVLASLASL